MKRLRYDLLGIFLFAFLLRAIFVSQWFASPYSSVPLLDANSYDQWALSISQGNWMRGSAFYQSPLYPYFLAFIYKSLGHSFVVVAWIQVILASFTCVLLAEIARVYFGKFAGLTAGVLASVDRALIFYSAPVMKETLGLFLLALFVFFILRARKVGKSQSYFVAGIFLGLAALVRTNLLILPLAILIFDFKKVERCRLISFGLGILISVMPATLHNWFESRTFVLVNYAGGFNFYVGNSPRAELFEYPEGISTDPQQEEQDVIRIANAESLKNLNPSEISTFWFKKGCRYLQQTRLANVTQLYLNKIWFFWTNHEVPDNYDMNFIGDHFSSLLKLPLVGFALIAALAIFGAVFRPDEISGKLAWMLFLYATSVLLFYVTDRYRLPATVFLIPLAGRAISLMIENRWQNYGKAALAALPFLVIGFLPMDYRANEAEARNWATLAMIESEMGRDQDAISSFAKSLRLDPDKAGSASYIKTAESYERLGRLQEAEELLRRATELYPSDGFTFHNLGRFKLEQGSVAESIVFFNRALKVSPWLYQPYVGLAAAYLQLGQLDVARIAIERGLQLKPNDPQLQTLLRKLN